MGFLDRLTGKKPAAAAPQPVVSVPPAAAPAAPVPVAPGNVMPRLVSARERLEAKDLPAALAIYEEVLAVAGERADVLVTISADLGINGFTREIVELVAPRYDADRHGPATGLNLLQAYLALRNADAAQHVLDILFGLNRPELEDRLHGFSNAIAELIHTDQVPLDAAAPGGATEPPKINMVSISKPMWYYGLEALPGVLPAKAERIRRVAFTQLALPGIPELMELAKQPEEELGRLSRALPLWFAETFYFSPHYAAIAAVGAWSKSGEPGHYALMPTEWTTENLRQIVDTTEGGLDYIFTGALRRQAGDYELVLRLWEVKKFRERKQFTVRWTPATAEAELGKLHEQLRLFMEWQADPSALAYVPPAAPRAWLDTLGAALTLFLAEKKIIPVTQLGDLSAVFETTATQSATAETAALAWLTLADRAQRLGLEVPPLPAGLTFTPRVAQARTLLGR